MNDKWKILIVDDEQDIHDVTTMALRRLKFQERGIEILHALSAEEAVGILIENPDIALIILDVVMESDIAGLDLVKVIRNDMGISNVRIVLRTGNPGLAPEDDIILAYDINDYRGKVELTAQSLRTIVITALRSYQSLIIITGLNQEIEKTQKELIFTLGEIAESRTLETGNHVKRVSVLSALLAEKMGYDDHIVEVIKLAASMHDLGKMMINDNVLDKPGRLTPEEFEAVKKHSTYGYEILKNSERELLKMAAIIAYEHHENVDGSGYPNGLTQDEIHEYSRIVALIDVFDALSLKRVYKEAWSRDKIYAYLKEQTGIKFDESIVATFFENIEEIEQIIDSLV